MKEQQCHPAMERFLAFAPNAPQGPAQKSDARKKLDPLSNPALICCVIFVRAKLLSNGGSVARRRSEPVPSLSPAHDRLDLA